MLHVWEIFVVILFKEKLMGFRFISAWSEIFFGLENEDVKG